MNQKQQPPPTPFISRRAIAFLITTILFLPAFILNITSNESLYNYNLQVVPQMQANPALGSDGFIVFMNLVSNIFNPVICAGYIIVFYLLSYRKLQILVFLIWFIGLSFILSILKEAIQQPRPYWISEPGIPQVKMLEWTCYSQYGCPSGHAMLGLILMEFILRFFARVHKPIQNNIWAFYILVVVLQMLVMFSRVILGMHSFNQVLFGALIGMFSISIYYLYIQKLLLSHILLAFKQRDKVPFIIINIILILISWIIEVCVSYLPSYSTNNYWAVIQSTSGCQKVKLYKSFQYKCLEDSTIIMASFGALIAFAVMRNPASLVKMNAFPNLSCKFVGKFFIMVGLALIPVAVFLNPLWGHINLEAQYLALVLWATQNIGFFLGMFILIALSPLVTAKAKLQEYRNPENLMEFMRFESNIEFVGGQYVVQSKDGRQLTLKVNQDQP